MIENDLNVDSLISKLQIELKQLTEQTELLNPLMIGIRTGGAWVAERLYETLALSEPLGLLDISFYRDDFSQMGIHPQVQPSELPFSVEGRSIILVDDVLYTGRTIRAALNEIFDYGRPRRVILVVLIDRDGRQIPVQADCVGAEIKLKAGQRIKLTGGLSDLRLSVEYV